MSDKKPYEKIIINRGVELVFGKNTRKFKVGEKTFDKEVLSPSLTLSWKDKKDEWQNKSLSLVDMDTLYRLLIIGPEVKRVEDKFKEEQKQEIKVSEEAVK